MRASCLAFCNWRRRGALLEEKDYRLERVVGKRPATASGCGGAGSSAASALLSDAPRHRPRHASLHPAPRRSQRRLTPFFSSLLVALLGMTRNSRSGGGVLVAYSPLIETRDAKREPSA